MSSWKTHKIMSQMVSDKKMTVKEDLEAWRPQNYNPKQRILRLFCKIDISSCELTRYHSCVFNLGERRERWISEFTCITGLGWHFRFALERHYVLFQYSLEFYVFTWICHEWWCHILRVHLKVTNAEILCIALCSRCECRAIRFWKLWKR